MQLSTDIACLISFDCHKKQCQASKRFVVRAIGTSFSAPHVAGLAALLHADALEKKQHNYGPAQVRADILKGADDRGKKGNDPYFGKGRINVAESLGL